MIDGSVDFRKSPADILDVEICCRISTFFIIRYGQGAVKLGFRFQFSGFSASMVGSNVMRLWDFL